MDRPIALSRLKGLKFKHLNSGHVTNTTPISGEEFLNPGVALAIVDAFAKFKSLASSQRRSCDPDHCEVPLLKQRVHSHLSIPRAYATKHGHTFNGSCPRAIVQDSQLSEDFSRSDVVKTSTFFRNFHPSLCVYVHSKSFLTSINLHRSHNVYCKW